MNLTFEISKQSIIDTPKRLSKLNIFSKIFIPTPQNPAKAPKIKTPQIQEVRIN